MEFLLQILGTLLGFAAVMLTASLVVMTVVRVVQYLANRRGKTLGEMLGNVNLSYRQANRDGARAGDAAQAAFTLDVMTFPTLNPLFSTELAKLKETVAPDQLARERLRMAERVEYVAEADLIRIVRRLAYLENGNANTPATAVETAASDGLEIPARWHSGLPEPARRVSAFVHHIESWFKTAEGMASETFKLEARRLTTVIASILVVLFNLDSLALASNLYRDAELRDELGKRAADMVVLAEGSVERSKQVPVEREELLEGLGEGLGAHNTTLNQPGLGIGWQGSWIATAWCRECAPEAVRRSWTAWFFDLGRWFVGLGLSSVLLSLGAPFWLDYLKTLLNLQNSLKQVKEPTPAKTPAKE